MINSMTGFGRSFVTSEDYAITTEIKSVNHRFCEMQVRMPRQINILEEEIKRCVGRYIKRGKIDITISVGGARMTDRELSVDWTLLDQYVAAHTALRNRYNIQDSIRYDQLLLLPNIVSIQEKEQIPDEFTEQILHSVQEATVQLSSMRKEEGAHLYTDLIQRLTLINGIIQKIKVHAPTVSSTYESRLYKKIKEICKSYGELDESKIVTEVALFADKCNIDEELTRLQSHGNQFKDVLLETGAVGRKLDFLVQEMNRESNTIGSKANDYTISKNVVELKSEIEKMKEQAQNIE